MKQLITLTICLFIFSGIIKADNDKPVTIDELPQKAQEFLKQHFSKNTISYAQVEKELWDKKYDVVFTNGEKIEFDKNGEWKEIDCKFSAVPDILVPQQIQDHIKKQFPQNKIIQIEKDSKGYEIKLNNKLELKYTQTFQLKEIDD